MQHPLPPLHAGSGLKLGCSVMYSECWAGVKSRPLCASLQGDIPLDPRLEAGMQLFGLDAVEIMREAAHDTKLLLASGPETIVLSFRGTSSAAAAWADLQVSSRFECPAAPLVSVRQAHTPAD